ncbi:DUF805 domain-containing protein [Lactococcus lactis]|uniref:DUF805 domain-containing protein n=1 Tax=Lactococcus lactis TaxID=1358 RepID=UPI0018C52C6F|nr:DUF805 domain-containing protein [Lactococcus lactis]MBG1279294.1 DUF805 domain-containing protein [Lactococcus lactis subsp. lactis]
MLAELIIFIPLLAILGLVLILYLTKQFVNLSFILIGLSFKGLRKLLGLPPVELRRFEKVRQSFSDYFSKVGNTWGKANRLDYLVGMIWSFVFGTLVASLFVKNWGMALWNWLQQFDASRVPPRGWAPVQAPSQSLLIGMILAFVLTLYWLVPFITLTVRRCRSMGNAALFFLLFVPFIGTIFPLVCLIMPEQGSRRETEPLDLKYYGDKQ